MIPKLIDGFDIDLKQILIEFEKESNVEFSIFAKIWKKMKFTLIFSGRPPKELVNFTNEALAYTKSFFVRSNSFLRKICCIYIMYGLYYKQPIRNSSKINITYLEWKMFDDFITMLKINKHIEPLYILSKLIFDNAFHFTVLNAKRVTPIPNARVNYDSEIIDDDICGENLKINNLLIQLESIEKVYESAKTSLTTKLNIPQIKYGNDNISKTLKNILTDSTKSVNNFENPGSSKESNSQKYAVLQKRRDIKQKSFQCKEKRYFLDRLQPDTKSNLEQDDTTSDEEMNL